MKSETVNRRDFVKGTVKAGAAAAALSTSSKRVLGANDRINVGLVGAGGRGRRALLGQLMSLAADGGDVQVVAVCDVYEKRKRAAAEISRSTGYLHYEDILERSDVDAIFNATPDHWHAKISIDAMHKGKDVYLEKPMTHTIEEAKEVYETTLQTGRVLQVGSQTTSSSQWWKARKAIQDGLIGKLVMSQGSYHRNSTQGEWNWPIDAHAGPQAKGEHHVDWKKWLGPAAKRSWDPDRFFRFRKYWDYSGGIATDLFYHVVAPLQICWGEPQFPLRVAATGGIYVFKDREVPDTFSIVADYPAEHSLVLSSSMANDTHIPGLIRGNEGTLMIAPGGKFESAVDHILVTPQQTVKKQFYEKYGTEEIKIPCGTTAFRRRSDPRSPVKSSLQSHIENFLHCVRSREKPVLDALTAYKAQVVIAMGVLSYRQGKVLYFDETAEKVVEGSPGQA